jgi:hypothetical protein
MKTIALKASKKKVKVSSRDDSEDEEKVVAMLAKNFRRLMRTEQFKKFSEKMKKAPREFKPEEAEKKDPWGLRFFECSGFGHIWADCENLKQGKGKAYNATLSDESEEEEASEQEKFLAFVAPHVEEEDSYSEHSDEDEEELKEAYKTLYVEFEKLREAHKQHIHDLNSSQTEKSSLLLKMQGLEEKLLETQVQLERVTNAKLTHMLSIQKSPTDKTGLGYVAPPSDISSTSKIVFVKPTVLEPPPTVEDKGKDKINGDVLVTQELPTIRRSPICHHCRLSGHIQPQCTLLKAQRANSRKKCLDKQLTAQDLWPSIRLHGIRLYGIKLQGIRLLNIKPHGIMT